MSLEAYHNSDGTELWIIIPGATSDTQYLNAGITVNGTSIDTPLGVFVAASGDDPAH